MGRKDFASKKFFRNKYIFADLVNNYLFQGKQVVKAESMVDRDTEAILATMKSTTLQGKYRDLLKQVEIKYDSMATYVLIGIENQSEVDYTMPIRVLLYDALEYERQREEALARYEASGAPFASEAEFLTGLPKGTAFKPVITLIMYLGSGPWDGPRCLHDNLQGQIPESIYKYVNNWHLPIIEPFKMTEAELDGYVSELGLVMKFLKYSHDKGLLLDKIKNDSRFNHVSGDALGLINSVSKQKLKLEAAEEEGGYNMCKAIDDLIKDSLAEGRAEGFAEGKAEGRIETALAMKKDGMPISLIAKYVHVSEDTVRTWFAMA